MNEKHLDADHLDVPSDAELTGDRAGDRANKREDNKAGGGLRLDADLGAFFREMVDDTLADCRTRPDEAIKEYVIGLLEDAAQKGNAVSEAVDRPLALVLHDALSAEPAVRFERLRKAGDGILLVGGLYRGHLQRVGLEDRYVVAVGQRAYRSASSILDVHPGAARVGAESPFDLLGELAARFRELMVLLRDVADTIVARAARSATDLARLCEMWLSDRSAHLGRMLRAHGVVLERALLPS